MRAWVKQRLAKGDMPAALAGIKAQLGCARHCTAAPVGVCHFVGLAISNLAFENIELAMQYDSCPNLYWSLGSLSPTLGDIGPMVRWELWASAARLNEPLPAVGDKEWERLARKFATALEIEVSNVHFTEEETVKHEKNVDRLARQELVSQAGFSPEELDKMSTEERALRWFHLNYCRFRTQTEPLAFQATTAVIAASQKLDAANKVLMERSGAKVLPYPASLAQVVLSCRNFERRVKFLQTLEAIRDYSSQHDGALPTSLDQLRLPAPNDPFTGQPFEYSFDGSTARLSQSKIADCATMTYEYELKVKK